MEPYKYENLRKTVDILVIKMGKLVKGYENLRNRRRTVKKIVSGYLKIMCVTNQTLIVNLLGL